MFAVEQPLSGRNPRQVFISHAHEDTEFAHRLAADLRTAGWRVWISPDSIQPGEKWVPAINRGLEESGVFVVALTPAAVKSTWVQFETDIAIEQAVSGEMRFIPLGVLSCRVPLTWNAYQRVPFDGHYETGLQALLARLTPGRTSAAAPSIPVSSPSSEPPTSTRMLAPALPMVRSTTPAIPREKQPTQTAPPSPELPRLLTIESPVRPELVLVPAGEFLMGSDPRVDRDASGDEQPQHRLSLPEFYIGKVPVTNAQYAGFVQATRRKAPEGWRNEAFPAGKAEHPVVNVTWRDAVDYCRWLSEAMRRSFRLPSEAEWEKAARGSDGRIYPWGSQAPDEKRCNFGMKIGDTTPVGNYADGSSPCGALDMAGNVWEWMSSAYKPYPYDPNDGREDPGSGAARVVRGGSYVTDVWDVRCASRDYGYPHRPVQEHRFSGGCASHRWGLWALNSLNSGHSERRYIEGEASRIRRVGRSLKKRAVPPQIIFVLRVFQW